MKPKLLKSKKAVIDDATFWIVRLLMIFIVVVSVVFFVNSILLKNIDTGSLELDLIAARIINSHNCLAYRDSNTQRIYPGVVNMLKYTESNLNENCIKSGKEPIVGVKIKLEGEKEIYLNKEYYEDTEPLTFSSKYYKVTKLIPVKIVNSEDKSIDGETRALEIVVVAKKR